MVRLTSGRVGNRNYSDLGLVVSRLGERVENAEVDFTFMFEKAYSYFKTLKGDYDAGFIDLGTYREFLSPLQKLMQTPVLSLFPQKEVEEVKAVLQEVFGK